MLSIIKTDKKYFGGAIIITSRPKSTNSKENCEKCKKLIDYTFGNGEFPTDILKIKRVSAKSQKARCKSGKAVAAYSATEKKEDKCRKLIKQIFGPNDKFTKGAGRVPVDNAILQAVSQVVTTGKNKNSGNADQVPGNAKETKDTIMGGCCVSNKYDTSTLAEEVRSDMKPAFDVYIPSLPTVSILTSDPIQLNINYIKVDSFETDRIESPICPVYLNATKSPIHVRHKSTTSQSNNEQNTGKVQRISDNLSRIYMPRYKDYAFSGNQENTDENLFHTEMQSKVLGDKEPIDVLKHTTQAGVLHNAENEAIEKISNIEANNERLYFDTYPSDHGKDKPQWNKHPKSPEAPSKQPTSPIFPQESESPLYRKESDPFLPDVKPRKPSGGLDNFVSSMINIEKSQKPSRSDSSESFKNENKKEMDLEITEMTFTEERTGLHFISPLKRPKLYDSLPPTKTDLDIIEKIAVQFYGKRPPLSYTDPYLGSNQIKDTNQEKEVDTKMIDPKPDGEFTVVDSVPISPKEDAQVSKPEGHLTKEIIIESPVYDTNSPQENNTDNLPMKTVKEDIRSQSRRMSNDFEYPWSPLDSHSRQWYFENNRHLQTLLEDKFHKKETLKHDENKYSKIAYKIDKENIPPSPLRITLRNTFEPLNKDITSKYKTMWYTIEDHCGPLKANQAENVLLGDTRFVSSTIMPEYAKKPRMQVILKEKSEARHMQSEIHQNSEQDKAKAISNSVQENTETNLTSSQEKMNSNFASLQGNVPTNLSSSHEKVETSLVSSIDKAKTSLASSQDEAKTTLASSQDKAKTSLASSQEKVETNLYSLKEKGETNLLSSMGTMPPAHMLLDTSENKKKLDKPQEKNRSLEMLPKMQESNILIKQTEEIQEQSDNLPVWLNEQTEIPKSLIKQSEESQEKSAEMLTGVFGKDTQETKILSNQPLEFQEKLQKLPEWQNKQTKEPKSFSKPQKDSLKINILSEQSQDIQPKLEQSSETFKKSIENSKLLKIQGQEIEENTDLVLSIAKQVNILSEQHESPEMSRNLSENPREETQEMDLSEKHQESEEEAAKLSEMLRKARLRSRLEYCQSYYTYMMMKQSMVLACKNCGQVGNKCGCPHCPPYSSPPSPGPQEFTPCPPPNKVPPSPSPIPPKISSPPIPPYCKPKKQCPPPVNASIGTCPKGCAPRRSICDPKKTRPKKNKSPCSKMSAVENLKCILNQMWDDISPPRVDNP